MNSFIFYPEMKFIPTLNSIKQAGRLTVLLVTAPPYLFLSLYFYSKLGVPIP